MLITRPSPEMARHRAVLRWLMQFWLANSLPSITISAIQSWKKEIPAEGGLSYENSTEHFGIPARRYIDFCGIDRDGASVWM
jgi:hypothetical protein